MRWAAIVCLIVGVAAGGAAEALAQPGADPSRRNGSAEAEAKAAFERGRAAHNAGKTDEAVSHFEKAVALEPASSLYQMWLGHAYSRQLSTAGFLRKPFIARRSGEAYNTAVKLDPASIDAAEARLDFFLDAPSIVGGGIAKAKAEAARLTALDAYRGGMATAKIAEHEKRTADAERLYRSLMVEYADRTAAVDALVTLLLNTKRVDEAFTVVDDRLVRRPDETASLYNLGRLSAVSGQHLARGEASLRRVLTLAAGDGARQSNAHYRLGNIKEKLGDTQAAAAEYQAALDLYPRHAAAAAALKKIQPVRRAA